MSVLSCRGCLVPKVPSPTCYILAVLSSDALSALCLSPSMTPCLFPSHFFISPPLSLSRYLSFPICVSPLRIPCCCFPSFFRPVPFLILTLPLCFALPLPLPYLLVLSLLPFCLPHFFFISLSAFCKYLPSISPPRSILLTVLLYWIL
jgi:hypothetical protein